MTLFLLSVMKLSPVNSFSLALTIHAFLPEPSVHQQGFIERAVLSLRVGPTSRPYLLLTPAACEIALVFWTHFYRVCLVLPHLQGCELLEGKVLLSGFHNPGPKGSVRFIH